MDLETKYELPAAAAPGWGDFEIHIAPGGTGEQSSGLAGGAVLVVVALRSVHTTAGLVGLRPTAVVGAEGQLQAVE